MIAASLDELGRLGAGQPDMVRHLWARIRADMQRCRAARRIRPTRLSPLSSP
jgi:hypothetical protein